MGERDLVITVVDLYAGEVLGTTTCFDPICWPSSGCTLIFRAIIQNMVGILGVCVGVGERDIVITIVDLLAGRCWEQLHVSALYFGHRQVVL